MIRSTNKPTTNEGGRAGFSLAESMIAVVIVGVMLVAALATLSGTRTGQFKMEGRATGTHLAQELMNEILSQPFEEQEGTFFFGRESGESATQRDQWDDVDDYDGLSESPPKDKSGTVMSDLTGWTRTVTVTFVNPTDLTTAVGSDTGLKRITVTVLRNAMPVAELVAIRSEAWPMEQEQEQALGVLLVIKQNSPTSQENKRIALLESWDFTVTTLKDTSSQSAYNTAIADVDVVLISEEVNSSTPASRLRNASVGVVNGDSAQVNGLGICKKSQTLNTRWLWVSDNTHYITSAFSTGWLRIFDWNQQALASKWTNKEASGSSYLGWFSPRHALLVIDAGGGLYGGGSAAGRRVFLPWGGGAFNVDGLSSDGETLLKRSLEWAGGVDDGSSGSAPRGPGRRNRHRNCNRNCDGHHSCRN